ncbi:MAG: ATP-binding protein [Gammaproteobacteria bacterium]
MEQDRLVGGSGHCQPDALAEAFKSFNQASSSLAEFYQGLEQQVTLLNMELEATRSERHEQAEERERLADRLQNLLDVLPAGVVVLDGDGCVQECNPAAIELLGEPLYEQPWRSIVARAFSPRWDDGHDITLSDGRCVNISTQPLNKEPGQILLIKDVTETRRMQDQVGRLKRLSALGEMAAALAHQVRTPLSSALLYASNLGRSDLADAVQQRFSKKLLSCLQNLEILVEDMLLFASGGRFDSQPHKLSALLNDLIDSLEHRLKETGFTVRVTNEAQESVVDVNRHALLSAMQNLVNNAIQAGNKPGEIGICIIKTDTGTVEISFSDDGPGIHESIRDTLFEPFVTTRSQGTGLGLAVVDAVVRVHNGQISYTSTAGGGATFIIELPLVIEQKNTLSTKR